MKEYDDYSAKEQQQLAVCQRLISEKVTCPRRKFAAIYKMRDLKVSASLRFRACSNCWAQ